MQQLTFDRYHPKNGHPPQDHILWDLPDALQGQRDAIIRQAGFDPAQIHEAGQLTEGWQTHPNGAVILAPTVDFETGDLFAVSREAV